VLDVSGYKFVIDKELFEKGTPFKVDMTYMGFSVTSQMEIGGGSSCGSSCSGGSCSTS
jgi:hypothetical protein